LTKRGHTRIICRTCTAHFHSCHSPWPLLDIHHHVGQQSPSPHPSARGTRVRGRVSSTLPSGPRCAAARTPSTRPTPTTTACRANPTRTTRTRCEHTTDIFFTCRASILSLSLSLTHSLTKLGSHHNSPAAHLHGSIIAAFRVRTISSSGASCSVYRAVHQWLRSVATCQRPTPCRCLVARLTSAHIPWVHMYRLMRHNVTTGRTRLAVAWLLDSPRLTSHGFTHVYRLMRHNVTTGHTRLAVAWLLDTPRLTCTD